MKPSKILALAKEYYEELVDHGGAGPQKMDEFHYVELPRDTAMLRNHVAWACKYIEELVEAEEYGAAQQWIGWVQGELHALGLYTIDEERAHGVPEQKGYDPIGGGGGTGRGDLPAGMRGED